MTGRKGIATAETLPAVPENDEKGLSNVETLDPDEKGVHTMDTLGGPLDVFDIDQARQLLAELRALDYRDEGAAYRLLGAALVVLPRLLAVAERAGGVQ